MKFNVDMILRGKLVVSWIEKNKRFNRVDVVVDRYGNRSVLSFDSICFDSFVKALNEYTEKGKVSFMPSESCRGRIDLDSFLLDLSGDKKFSARLDLGFVREGCCGLIMRSDYAKIHLCFNGDQIKKIVDKFNNAVKVKEALRKAEKEIIL